MCSSEEAMLLRDALKECEEQVKYWRGMAYFYAGQTILFKGYPDEWSLVTCCHCRCRLHYCHAVSCTHGLACHLCLYNCVSAPCMAPDVQWNSQASASVARPLMAQNSCGEPNVSKKKRKRYRKPKTNKPQTEPEKKH